MVTRSTYATPEVIAYWDRWNALYNEAFEKYQGEWYAIADGVLYHAAEARDVRRMLDDAGVDRTNILVHHVLPPPPHRV